MLELADAITSPFAALLLLNLGGAISRVSDDATALGGRAAPFAFHLNTMWEGEEHDDAEHRVDARRDRRRCPRGSHPGWALNFYTEIGEDEIRDTFGSRLDRLRKTKQMYDPTNLFRLNQNIAPA